jgi:three-Cys-motif partner protein
MAVDHEFGGQHTELKLSIIEKYLKAFSAALRRQFTELWFIDAFAGTGARTVRHDERPADFWEPAEPEKIEQRRGSAQIAIDVKPNFDRIIFIESKPSHCEALKELAAKYPDREILIIQGDANAALRSAVTRSTWASIRVVLFLDPYGMEVDWSTLEIIAKTRAIDVWFLFPISGLYRQATKRISSVDEHKEAALTRILGSDDWKHELYADSGQGEMFGNDPRVRSENVVGLEKYVRRRLQTIFACVLPPLQLPRSGGPQRFSLFLCISNDQPRAIGLATKIGSQILKVGSSS